MIIIDGSDNKTPQGYSILKTAGKAIPPFVMILIIQAAKAAAAAAGITIDDATLTSIVLAGYGGLVGFINWLKNRKK